MIGPSAEYRGTGAELGFGLDGETVVRPLVVADGRPDVADQSTA